nr:terminase family protein [Nannocystis sp. ILAH1]
MPGEDLIIDVRHGDRFLRRETSDENWNPKAEVAKLYEVPLRCSRDQLALVMDDSDKHLFASGGNRSAKTTAGLYWIARQWMLRGGNQRRIWLCASILPKAFELLQKLFVGTGESPPVLPLELVKRKPSTPRASDLQTILVDGTLIDLKYYSGDPSAERLKSNAIIAALVDEAANLPTTNSLTALRARCLDDSGRLFFASTPTPASFLKAEVVEPAIEFSKLTEEELTRLDGAHIGAPWIYKEFALLENPWLDRQRVEREIKSLRPDDPAVERDYFGRWTTGCGLLWRDFDDARHVVVHEARDFNAIGLSTRGAMSLSNHVPITDRVVSMLFGQPSTHYSAVRATNQRYVLGMDVNCHPMTSVAIQVTAPKEAEEDRDQWHFWCFEQIRTSHGSSFAHADQIQNTYFGRMLEPTGKKSPFEGTGIIVDAKALGWDPTAHRFGGDPQGIAMVFGRLGFDLRAPLYVPTEKGMRPKPPNRKDSFILVKRLLRETRLHILTRCNSVVEAFRRQEDSGDGETPIKNDPLDSAMDALRYALYGIVHAPAPVRGVWR